METRSKKRIRPQLKRKTKVKQKARAKIIVELCQNHLGDRKILREMIRAAAENGADYVKIQSIFSEDLTQRERFEEGLVDENGVERAIKRPYQAEFDRLSKLDLTLDDHRFFIDECVRRGVTPLTTIFAIKRVPEVAALAWPQRVVKVASYDCASLPFLKALSDHFDHLIISTGATYDHEIERAADLVKQKGKRLTLLHCVTSYPNTLSMANLKRMAWLKKFTDEVGWSDHTLAARDRLTAAKAALYLGAEYVERHFTILPGDKTKDGPVSITADLLKELAAFREKSREEQRIDIEAELEAWEILLGDETRPLTQRELLNRDYYRGRFASKVGNRFVYNWE